MQIISERKIPKALPSNCSKLKSYPAAKQVSPSLLLSSGLPPAMDCCSQPSLRPNLSRCNASIPSLGPSEIWGDIANWYRELIMPLATTSAAAHASLQTNSPLPPLQLISISPGQHPQVMPRNHSSLGPSPAAIGSGSEANHTTALHPDFSFLGTAHTPCLASLDSPSLPSEGQP